MLAHGVDVLVLQEVGDAAALGKLVEALNASGDADWAACSTTVRRTRAGEPTGKFAQSQSRVICCASYGLRSNSTVQLYKSLKRAKTNKKKKSHPETVRKHRKTVRKLSKTI